MDVIIMGSTGGIGKCVFKYVLHSPKVEKVYCQYRSKEKFLDLAHRNDSGMMSEKLVNPDDGKAGHILQKLYAHPSRETVCIYTAFCINPLKRVGTYRQEEIEDNISSNVLDFVSFVNALVRYKRDCGTQLRIINIDSGAAYKPLESWGLYCAGKAYVNMFLKTVQLENPDMKIVSYEPGVVDTPMQEQIRNTEEEVFGQAAVFREYHEKGLLRSPDVIAEDIVKRFVESWETAEFTGGYGR